MSDTHQPTSSTERVRRFRKRIRQEGWITIEVKVPADRADDLRAYAKTLGKPKPKANKEPMPLFPDLT